MQLCVCGFSRVLLNYSSIPSKFLQQPVTDEAELAALRAQGLTDKGLNKVTKGDLRCRPPRVYSETFFDKKLPQFRLRTVVETARAEDVVMVWAYVTERGKLCPSFWLTRMQGIDSISRQVQTTNCP